MAAFYVFFPPSGGGTANASVGTNGVTAPTSSTEVAGINPSGNLQPLKTNAAGSLITTSDPAVVEHVIVDSSALPLGASTSALQTISNTNTANLSRLAGSLVPTAYDEVDLTYLVSGNGTGSIGTAVYKLLGATVKTLTLTYDASNRLATVVAT